MPQRCGWRRGGGVPLAPWRGGGAAGAAVEGACRRDQCLIRGGISHPSTFPPFHAASSRNAAAVAAVEWRRWRRGGVEVRLAPQWRAPVGATNALFAVALATPPLFHLSTRRQAALHRAMRRIKKERSPMECHQRPVMGFFRVYYDCGCP